MDSTQHIQRVPDWKWPRRRHAELEARAQRVADQRTAFQGRILRRDHLVGPLLVLRRTGLRGAEVLRLSHRPLPGAKLYTMGGGACV